MKKISYLILITCVLSSSIHSQKIPYFDFSEFSVYSIEREIFRLINTTREKKGLSPLSVLSELVPLARKHSRDMARQGRLTHVSSDGKTYSDRLIEAGVYFLGNGENAAFSQSFSPKIIHQSLLDSPQHRENILEPSFNGVGIGVFHDREKGFFVTQDFLRSFPLIPNEEIKQEIIKRMNEERNRHDLPLIVFSQELNEYAEDYARRNAEGKAPPEISKNLGIIKTFTSNTSTIDRITEDINKLARDRFSSVGIGVTFGRNEKNIGGAYHLVVAFAGEGKHIILSAESI